MKRYNTLDTYLKEKFNGKIGKVCIDGGFSCPNRENGKPGCLFCSENGSGEFAGDRNNSITSQIENQKIILNRKWKLKGYIAYFQNFSNTYADISTLRKKYDEALSCNGIVGIAIATRADCLDDKVIELLKEINLKTFLWIEIGFQTCHAGTISLINRGYGNDIFDQVMRKLNQEDISVVVHLIAGLPGENREDFLDSVKYISKHKLFGVKIHSLYIQTDSPLYEYYLENSFEILTASQYVTYVCDALELISPEVVIHRLTGDGKKQLLVKPTWILDKLKVLSSIDEEMTRRNSVQGRYYQI